MFNNLCKLKKMQLKTTILILSLFFSLNTFSQCPGSTAQSYKTKAMNAGTGNTEAIGAYTQLATYYAYKCECENGVTNPEALVQSINAIANVINSKYSKYGTVATISSCKSNVRNGNGVNGKTSNSSNGLSNSQNLENMARTALGDDNILTQSLTNYNNGVELRKAIDNGDYLSVMNNVTSTISTFANILEQNRMREQMLYQQQLAEQERKEAFKNQADEYRNNIARIINSRKEYFTTQKEINTYSLDGSRFEPIYCFFAYTLKGENEVNGYDFYKENVSYPDIMEFKMNQKAEVKFSKIFGVFPNSDGKYPFFREIKKQMLEQYPNINLSQYEVKFIPFSKSVKGFGSVMESLKNEIDYTIDKAMFYKATPELVDEIFYINDKTTTENSNDYWEGGKVKTKEDVDYWNSTTKKEKSKPVPTEKKEKSKKIDYWD